MVLIRETLALYTSEVRFVVLLQAIKNWSLKEELQAWISLVTPTRIDKTVYLFFNAWNLQCLYQWRLMKHPNSEPSQLLVDHLALFDPLKGNGSPNKVLDLACGSGRNGLYLLKNNIPVVFADINPAVLDSIADSLNTTTEQADFWLVDFERETKQTSRHSLKHPALQELDDKRFDAILVFNYLHRPLIEGIKKSLVPGGLLFYQTFTSDQATLGRPSNPDYLLQAGELKSWFQDWEIIYYFEGRLDNPLRAVASLVARSPEA